MVTVPVPNGFKCDDCPKAKTKQLQFRKESTNRSEKVLDLICSDVCGPLEVESLGGKRYIPAFIDDLFQIGTLIC